MPVYHCRETLSQIVPLLLKWFAENARVLPWRGIRNPYFTWVSEIMLQQTRVEQVKSYYLRFIAEVPDIQALADLPEERLLKLWEGLGYYSRVKNMQKAAGIIMEKHNGVFPQNYADIIELPGIGEYTAGAILSIAFDLPVPAVDGNVLRVLSRVLESRQDIALPETKRVMTESLREIYPDKNCGDLTQSLMELGATVCLPNGEPLCLICPLNHLCKASQNHTTNIIPFKTAKKPRIIENYTILILRSNTGKLALKKRPARGLLASLWELPSLPGHLNESEIHAYLKEHHISCKNIKKSVSGKHIFTHKEWLMNSFELVCDKESEHFVWASPEELETHFSLPSAYKLFL